MPELNALSIDEATGAITIPVGATGRFIFFISTTATLDANADRAVFGVGTRSGASASPRYSLVFRRDYPIEVDADGKYFVNVLLSNAETRGLQPGAYYWDMTIVTDPQTNDKGEAVTDEPTDDVYPVYATAGALPTFTVLGGVPIV
jgi:hypothetical protein